MMQVCKQDVEVLSLLRGLHTKRLMADLTEERLQKRCNKSKTIQAGQDIYVNLVNMLLEVGYFNKINVDQRRLYDLLLEKDIIDDALAPVSQGLNISTHLGAALFYLIIGWISSELKLSYVDHCDIITCYSLASTDEGGMARILKYLVQMVIDSAMLRMQAEGCHEHYDRDLQLLLQNGSASGIYGRLKLLMDCGQLIYGGNTNEIVFNTLVMELPRLSRSRQIVFTRVVKHITDGIVGKRPPTFARMSQNYNIQLWKLLVNAIKESGIAELAYDDIELLHSLRSLGYQFDTLTLARILSQDKRSYVDNYRDFQRNRDMVGALYAMRKNGIQFDFPDTFNLAEGNLGTLLLDRHVW